MARGRSKLITGIKLLAPALVTIASLVALRIAGPDLVSQQRLSGFIQPLGHWAPLAYIALLAIRPFTLISGQLVTAVGGMLFGGAHAMVYSAIGDFLGALLVFRFSRRFGSRIVKRLAKGRYPALVEAARRHDFKFALLATINPLIPTDIANAAAAASGARQWPTLLGMMLATLPGIYLTAQFGSSLSQGQEWLTAFTAAGMLLSLGFGVYFGRGIARQVRDAGNGAPASRPAGEHPIEART